MSERTSQTPPSASTDELAEVRRIADAYGYLQVRMPLPTFLARCLSEWRDMRTVGEARRARADFEERMRIVADAYGRNANDHRDLINWMEDRLVCLQVAEKALRDIKIKDTHPLRTTTKIGGEMVEVSATGGYAHLADAALMRIDR